MSFQLLSRNVLRLMNFYSPKRKLSCPCGCPSGCSPGAGNEVKPPAYCRVSNVPPNPCVPRFHHGKDTWKKYKYFTLFVCFPLILFQMYSVCGHETPSKGECRDYEYMRLRAKKYPWRDGVQTLFHNERVNHVPGECVPPPLDCD